MFERNRKTKRGLVVNERKKKAEKPRLDTETSAVRCREKYSKNPVAKLSAVCTMKPKIQLRTVDTMLHCSVQRPRFGIICDFDARLGPKTN
jgi:hypothetical protein